jgi:hypothetical protein
MDPRTYTIKRIVLAIMVERAITKGKEEGTWKSYLTPEQLSFQIDSLRDVVRTCEGVAFGHFKPGKFACPAAQAGIRGWYGTWFTRWYDKFMCDIIEPDPSIESGWSARVEN